MSEYIFSVGSQSRNEQFFHLSCSKMLGSKMRKGTSDKADLGVWMLIKQDSNAEKGGLVINVGGFYEGPLQPSQEPHVDRLSPVLGKIGLLRFSMLFGKLEPFIP